MVPGRKLSSSTSAVATSRSTRERSPGSFRSSTTLFLPRFHTREADQARVGSPPGGSTLMTSAPWSDR